MELIKTVEAPAPINSASLHPEKDFFVAGGDDFKLYKFDYSTKEELGEQQSAPLYHEEEQSDSFNEIRNRTCQYRINASHKLVFYSQQNLGNILNNRTEQTVHFEFDGSHTTVEERTGLCFPLCTILASFNCWGEKLLTFLTFPLSPECLSYPILMSGLVPCTQRRHQIVVVCTQVFTEFTNLKTSGFTRFCFHFSFTYPNVSVLLSLEREGVGFFFWFFFKLAVWPAQLSSWEDLLTYL